MQLVHLLSTRIKDKRTRTIIDFAVIFFVAVFVFRNFMFSAEWPAGGDVMGYISREYLYAKDYKWLFVWRPNSFGYPEGINLMDFFFMSIHFSSGDAAATAKIFAFSAFVLAGFAIYAFCYHISKKNLPALAGSLIYLLNPGFLTHLTEAHLDIMYAYALAPLIFLFLDKTLEGGKAKYILTTAALVSVMLSSFHPQLIVIYGSFLIFFALAKLLSLRISLLPAVTRRWFKSMLVLGLIAIPLSAYVWMPFLFNVRAPYLSSVFSRGSLEDTYAIGYKTFQEAFVLGAKEQWGYSNLLDVTKDAGFPLLPVGTILLLVLAVAYTVTFFFKHNRYSMFFGLSAFLSILISMGPYSPFGSSFLWAWFNMPYFTSFRAISRWTLMTAFANSFFICSSVSIAIAHIKNARKAHKRSLEEEKKVYEEPSATPSPALPINIDKITSSFKRLLYHSSILFLIAVLASGFISTWFLFSNGLQTYTPPTWYIKPYEYLREVPGEYKVVTVGRSMNDWSSESPTELDFLGSMPTFIGWTHDLGYESTFIHDKPTLQDGGLSSPSTDFVNYLRFGLMKYNLTRDMLKVLGRYDYKYVVIPSYVTENVREFFLAQYGGKMIFNESNSVILENEFYTPSLFGPRQLGLVLGGPESLFSLHKIDSFDLNETSLISIVQPYGNLDVLRNLISDSSMIVLSNCETPDLMIDQTASIPLVYATNYGVKSSNAKEYWIRNDYWTNLGELVLGQYVLTTCGNLKINMPFDTDSEGTYEVFLRVAFAPNRGKLLVSIDSLPIAEIKPCSESLAGLKWVKLKSDLKLEAGAHTITLVNDGSGYNDIDAVAVIEKSKLVELQNEVQNLFLDYDGDLLYLMDAEKGFYGSLPNQWFSEMSPSEGYTLHIDGGMNIAHSGRATSSSSDMRLPAELAIDENPASRWASLVGLPQWLEVTWPTTAEVLGVTVRFEYAYAEDYRIQTWNGNDWIDQVVVEKNAVQNRTHLFEQPVITEKMRLLVTSAPSYNMVSIYEMEVLSTGNMASSEIYVPKSANYKFTARLQAEEESNSTFFLKVDNQSLSLSISSSNQSDFTWRDLGTVFLQAGEHRIAVGSVGPVTLDKLAAHLIDNGKQTIEELFRTQVSSPYVQFEKINPCKYIAHVNTTTPFLLTFSESYHPMWKAYVEGQEISPIATNFIVNGYQMNKTGSYDVELYFVGQKFADAGLLISGTTMIVLIIAFPLRNRLFRKLKQIRLMLRRSRKQSLLLLTEKAVSLCQNITNLFCYLKSQQHCLESVTP